MIFVVDEDTHMTYAYRTMLEARGFEVRLVSNAAAALLDIREIPVGGIDALIIDVMLNPGVREAGPEGRYSKVRTHDYLQTGLRLLDDVIEEKGDGILDKVILWSRATLPNPVDAIRAYRAKFPQLRFVEKRAHLAPELLAQLVVDGVTVESVATGE